MVPIFWKKTLSYVSLSPSIKSFILEEILVWGQFLQSCVEDFFKRYLYKIK